MLTRARRRSDDPRTADAGFSLIESLVTMAITTVVGTIAVTLFVSIGRTSGSAAANSSTTDGVRLGVSAMASTLRVADTPTNQPGATTYRIVSPLSRTSIAFFANDNANRAGTAARTLPSRVVYTWSGTTVTETRYQPVPGATAAANSWTSNYPTTPTTTRTLLSGVSAVRFDYATLKSGVLTPVADADLGTAGTADAVVTVTVTATTVAITGRPAQTLTATAVLTGSTS